MILDTSQITTNKFPYYSVITNGNAVIGCVKDPTFECKESKCEFKKVCLIERSRNERNKIQGVE